MTRIPPPPLDAYRIISDAIERGIEAGVRKAVKHEDDPPSDALLDRIADIAHHYAMLELEEVVRWEYRCDVRQPETARPDACCFGTFLGGPCICDYIRDAPKWVDDI